jgi:hypothetical protein
MDRREFIRWTGVGLTVAASMNSKIFFADAQQKGVADKSKIGYIREEIPSFTIPPYKGKRYEDTVPDTLDLAERAELAINGMTSMTDPDLDYEIYFLGAFYRNPPVLRHSGDTFNQPKFCEALPLMRIITGSSHHDHVDPIWMASILKSIGPDGLYYLATEGRPWFRKEISGWNPKVVLPDGTVVSSLEAPLSQVTNQTASGRIIGTMTLYYLRDKNPIWKTTIERMIDKWSQLAINKGDFSYYPVALLVPNARIDSRTEVPTGLLAAEMGYRMIQGLAQYYEVTGYDPARALCRRLVNYVKDQAVYFDSKGRFIDGNPNKAEGHFHSHTLALLSFLDYALAVGDQELTSFVKSSYEWARDEAYGSPLTGFFPEGVLPQHPVCELCCIADMTALALKLSEASAGDYWDDVDRYLRNGFAEGQLTKADWVYRVAKSLKEKPVAYNETAERPAERSLGTFLGYITGSDYGINHGATEAPTGIANCCTGNATRAIYYAWQRILDNKKGRLRVNLLLNRASPWADVYSYIPYEGRVDVKVKSACDSVQMRVPEWVESNSLQVICQINGKPRRVSWEGRYVDAGSVRAGDTVAITFPIGERTVKQVRMGGADYTLIIKGNTVVFINPPGKYYPLYQRDHYRKNKVRWRKIRRFVSDQRIEW